MRQYLSKATLSGAVLFFGLFAFASIAVGAKTTPASHKATTPAATRHLSPALLEGQTLFDENCSSCHGIDAQGSPLAPKLQGVGAATVDLWVSSGWMPLAVPTAQPNREPDRFTPSQTIDIAEYVASLKPGGLPIPKVDIAGASLSTGAELFAENCSACHTITGAGDALSNGLSAPSLHGLSPVMITEAIETAPGNMPRFTPGALTPAQVRDVVAYVDKVIEHPDNPGGIGLGGVGPVAEGFVGLFVGVGACLLFALWVGDRNEEDEESGESVGEVHG